MLAFSNSFFLFSSGEAHDPHSEGGELINQISLLIEASTKGNVEQVKNLLMCKVNPRLILWRGDRMFTPLYAACYKGHVEVVENLLAAKADSSHVTRGYSPLALASFRGNTGLVTLLLAGKADPNQLINGITGDRRSECPNEVAIDLLGAKATFNQLSEGSGFSPLFLAGEPLCMKVCFLD